MPLEVPRIDVHPTYQEILEEALARIPIHNPEWTNYNIQGDPGVTLLQLFAFMHESLLYRANLIPERNRRKFLSLLGVPMRAPAAAEGFVVFRNEKGPRDTVTLPADTEVRAGKTPFRTLDSVDVVAVDSEVFYKRRIAPETRRDLIEQYRELYGSHSESGDLEFYETVSFEPPVSSAAIPAISLQDTVDGSLWVAVFARQGDSVDEARQTLANATVNLGVMPDYAVTTKALEPGGPPATEGQPALEFELASGEYQPGDEQVPRYRRLQALADTDGLTRPGIVQLTLPGADALTLWEIQEPLEAGTGDYPPFLEDTNRSDRVVTWIRVRLPDTAQGAGLNAKLSWIGINAVRIRQRAHVTFENLGTGTGEPDQIGTLANTPVLPDSLRLTVDGIPWAITDELYSAASEASSAGDEDSDAARVFSLDAESGEIRFGDGLRGARPARGAAIRASYDYGGGREGNVNIGAASRGPTLPSGFRMMNPLPTWGGNEAETVSEAEKNIPRFIRHRDRLVSREDFEDIVRRAPGVDIGRVDVLPEFRPDYPDFCTPGAVTVMVVPRQDAVQPDAPRPDRLTLDLLCRYLDPRRLVTTAVYLSGPAYQGIYLSVGIQPVAGLEFPAVREAVNAALRRFLSPLSGGRDGRGWPLERSVVAQELWAEASRVEGVAYVTGLQLGDVTGAAVQEITLQGLELPRLLAVQTRQGDPEPLGRLLGGPRPGDVGRRRRIVPIPVVSEEC